MSVPSAASVPARSPAAAAATAQARSPSAAAVAGRGGDGWWPFAVIGLGLVAVAMWLVRLRRRREENDELSMEASPGMEAPPVDAAPQFLTPDPAPRPSPQITYSASRIGLNLVTATIEGEVTVSNSGAAPLVGVRIRIGLLGVASRHDEAIAALHDAPAGRVVGSMATLEPGEARTIRAVAALEQARIAPLQAAGRAMFVPLVVVTIDWRDQAGTGRVSRAFAVGIRQDQSDRLAPVWLDQEIRRYDHVATRPHGRPLDRLPA